MKETHPLLYVLLVAFGLKGFARANEEQFSSTQNLSNVSVRISADMGALIRAAEEAGGFAGAE